MVTPVCQVPTSSGGDVACWYRNYMSYKGSDAVAGWLATLFNEGAAGVCKAFANANLCPGLEATTGKAVLDGRGLGAPYGKKANPDCPKFPPAPPSPPDSTAYGDCQKSSDTYLRTAAAGEGRLVSIQEDHQL